MTWSHAKDLDLEIYKMLKTLKIVVLVCTRSGLITLYNYLCSVLKEMKLELEIVKTSFFLSGFSVRKIHDSQDRKGRGVLSL